MAMRKSRFFLSTLALLIGLLASCSPAAPDPENLLPTIQAAASATLGAQLGATQAAQATQSAVDRARSATEAALNAQALAASQTAAASITPSITPPATLVGIIQPNAPRLSLTALAAVNCRFGPSTGLAVLALLEANRAYPILGRNAANNWVQIEFETTTACWVAVTSNVQIDGDVTRLALAATPTLPTRTPGPTEAPGFQAARPVMTDCEGLNYLAIAVQPTGGLSFSSGSVTVTLQSDGTQVGYRDSNSLFGDSRNACGSGTFPLGPGQQGWVTVRVSAAASQPLRVNLRLCTERGQHGQCFSTALNYNP